MHQSTIQIKVGLDENKVPESLAWTATDSSAATEQMARAMMLSFWDPADKTALRIDLWTKEMMVDEMADFFYQNLMSMADTFLRATQDNELTSEMKNFAKDFYKKFTEKQIQQNK